MRIALVAHDHKKEEMLLWAKENARILESCELYATGTTGNLISKSTGLHLHLFKSGPLGGDMQIGALIAEGKLDALIFFWDPLSAHPHDVDVKALLRLAVLYNLPMACNKATADYIISKKCLVN